MEARPYVPGDEARHVDWRASARTGDLYSKRFEPEHARVCLVVMDPDIRQFFGTRVRFKSVQAARVGAAAAWWALHQGDRIGSLDTTDGSVTGPRQGKGGVMAVLQALQHTYAHPPQDTVPPLANGLPLVARLARGGTVVVVAEPHRLAAVPLSWWARLGMRQSVHLVCVADPLEVAPPACRLVVATPSGRQVIDLADPLVRQAWLAERGQALAGLEQAGLPGVHLHVVMTDQPAATWLPLPLPGAG